MGISKRVYDPLTVQRQPDPQAANAFQRVFSLLVAITFVRRLLRLSKENVHLRLKKRIEKLTHAGLDLDRKCLECGKTISFEILQRLYKGWDLDLNFDDSHS